MSPVAWHPEGGPRAWRRRLLVCAPFSALCGWFFQALVSAHTDFGNSPYPGEYAIAITAGVLLPPLVAFVGYPLFGLVTDKLADALTTGHGPRPMGPLALASHVHGARRRQLLAIEWRAVAAALAGALDAELPDGLSAASEGTTLLVTSVAAPPECSTYAADLAQLGPSPSGGELQQGVGQLLGEVREFAAAAGGASWKPAATGSIAVVEAGRDQVRVRYEAMRRPTGLGVSIPLPRATVQQADGHGPAADGAERQVRDALASAGVEGRRPGLRGVGRV